jgi:hypothetical protein
VGSGVGDMVTGKGARLNKGVGTWNGLVSTNTCSPVPG